MKVNTSGPAVLVAIVALLALSGTGLAAHVLLYENTHTDFGTGGEASPATLDNATVVGSGDSADVAYLTAGEYNVVDDSGDGAANDDIIPMFGDDGNNNALRSELKITPQTNRIDSLELYTVIGATAFDYGYTVDIYLTQESVPDGNYAEGQLIKSGWDPDMVNGLQTIDVQNTSVDPTKPYVLEFVTSGSNNDGTQDALGIESDDSFTSDWASTSVTGSLSEGGNITVVGQNRPAQGTYTSATHSVGGAAEGFANVSVANASLDIIWEYDSGGGSWQTAASTTVTSTGNYSQSLPDVSSTSWRTRVEYDRQSGATTARIHDEGIAYEPRAPTTDVSPADGARFNKTDITIDATLSDQDLPDPQSDDVDLAWYVDGSQVNSQTNIGSEGTYSYTATGLDGGAREIGVKATDTEGHTTWTNHTIYIPGWLHIYKERRPATPVDADLTYFGRDEGVFNDSTGSNGRVRLDDLPTGQGYVVQANGTADQIDRRLYLDDIHTNYSMYLLNQTAVTTHAIAFRLDDRTGEFTREGTDTSIEIQRSLEKDFDGDGTNETRYKTIGSDVADASDTVLFEMQDEIRHRVIVDNNDGERRILGSYTPIQDEAVVLRTGAIDIAIDDPTTNWSYGGEYLADSDTVQFEFNDTQQDTSEIWLTIYERNNESNVLYPNQSLSGPFGGLKVSQSVPAAQNDSTWIIEAIVKRNGNSYQIKQPVGPRSPALPQLPARLKIIISIGSILVVTGLFSQLNGYVGGLVVAGLGGLWWYVDFLPPGTGLGVVVLAMIAAAAIFLRERARGQAP